MTSSSSSLCAWLLVMMLACGSRSCPGLGTFGFDVHHRYSDPVKGIMAIDDLPEKGSIPYYAALAHRDRLIHGRGLAAAGDSPLTFADGSQTFHLNSLGHLYYANVSVGTPSSWYLVALDTGSDLFWLPCDCTSCVHGVGTSSGEIIEFNIYSPNTSSTSSKVPCNSTMCAEQRRCSAPGSDCPYQVSYVSGGTSSTGILVEDVLRLTTDDAQSKPVNAEITFGCGKVETGAFLRGGAPNGLLGLGIEDISVPSTLASKGIASNSFSLCFERNETGRINFGDKGSLDQRETPFNIRQPNPTYSISVTQIIVGGNATDVEFDAVFDSGTALTYLKEPAYTLISESFNSLAKENRHSSATNIPFEYCYDLSATNQTNFLPPTVNLTMKGGAVFDVTHPTVTYSIQGRSSMYCLAVLKNQSDDNIIGLNNFMTGYKIVFDREKLVLGWKASNCYDELDSVSPTNSLAIPPTNSHAIPPAAPPTSGAARPPTGHSARLMSLISVLLTILIMTFAIV